MQVQDIQFATLNLLRNKYVGSHFSKGKSLESTVISFYKIVEYHSNLNFPNSNDWKKVPFQFFIRSPRGGDPTFSESDLIKTAKLIKENGYSVYIHSPYYINIAQPVGKVMDVLKEDLQIGSKIGCKGVVLHVGKYKNFIEKIEKAPVKKKASDLANKSFVHFRSSKLFQDLVKQSCKLAFFNNPDFDHCVDTIVQKVNSIIDTAETKAEISMKNNLDKVLQFASDSCPLLLETPAGQGSELLQCRKRFAKFINSFTGVNKNRIGVCVDTCHVFACGFDPLDYIKFIEKECKIHLIHLNNSKNVKGSCKDRHSFILRPGGKIPNSEILAVLNHCVYKNYNMITE